MFAINIHDPFSNGWAFTLIMIWLVMCYVASLAVKEYLWYGELDEYEDLLTHEEDAYAARQAMYADLAAMMCDAQHEGEV
jgi:hypothetical protein